MGRLFGRPISDMHPAHLVFEAMLASAVGAGDEPVVRAVVCNLRHDSRVGPERESSCALDWNAPSVFRSSYGSYYHTKIRTAKIPDFALDNNELNIVYRPGKRNRLHEGLFLATLFDVSRLHDLYSHAYDRDWTSSRGERPFSGYPRNESCSSWRVSSWVENRMRNDGRRIELIDATLEYMRLRLSQGAFFHPTWCVVYDDVEKQPYSQWPLALGLGHWAGSQRWCFAVCHSVKRAEVVAIPTVLDSGLNPYFFPSPPTAKSGHPIDISFRGGGLIQEFINRQVPLYIEDHPMGVHGACHKTRLSNVELAVVRLRHWNRLRYQYQPVVDVEAWVPHGDVS